MPSGHEARHDQLMAAAAEYHARGRWEEKLNALQQALVETRAPGFPPDDKFRYIVRYELGTVARRFGHYEKAEQEYRSLLDDYPNADPALKASVLGELGVLVARRASDLQQARGHFREQGRQARLVPSSLHADAEICRATGNEGMAMYNIWRVTTHRDPAILVGAIAKMNERIALAQKLQARANDEDPQSKFADLGRTWEVIGLNRLSLLYIAAGDTAKAVDAARQGQQRQISQDPTVLAFSSCFLGNALWHDGQKDAAIQVWNVPAETCSPPAACCKEPSDEHNGYLRLMANAGVDLAILDELGLSALDYAVLGNSSDAKKAVTIAEGALRRGIRQIVQRDEPNLSEDEIQERVDSEIEHKKRQAELRRQYRTVLQERIRPELRTRGGSTFKNLRSIYSNFVSEDTEGRSMFDKFKYVRYSDFKNHKKLPRSDSGLVQVYNETELDNDHEELFIIFFSYRWIGKASPDDDRHTQWNRMIRCADAFLAKNPAISPEKLGIWLDIACIDSIDLEARQRGIDALPLAVIQCNAMISLVDPTYLNRAWCVVELMFMRALRDAYHFHAWWEESEGVLRQAELRRQIPTTGLGLTFESDRPSVDFLIRQSVLLGNVIELPK